MKAKLTLEDGREIAVDVSEETLKKIEKPKKKTGYERVLNDEIYHFDCCGEIDTSREDNRTFHDKLYDNAIYYSDKTVAENNARADKLYRQLRRFAVEHRETALNWNVSQDKWVIYYWYGDGKIKISQYAQFRDFGNIYFDSKETAEAAIEEFKDELIWYFTEYKDSL